MKRLRLRTLMALVLLIGLGLALVIKPTPIGNSLAFTASLFAVLVAAIGAMAGRGRIRARCLGFVTLGAGYLVLSLGPWFDQNVGGHLVTSMLIDGIYEQLGFGGRIIAHVRDAGIVTVLTGPTPPGRSGTEVARLLHSLLAMVFGTVGAIIADRFARSNGHATASHSPSAGAGTDRGPSAETMPSRSSIV